MIKKITSLTFLVFLSLLVVDQQNQVAISSSGGAPAGHTGSPFDGKTCAKSGCHAGTATALPGLITSNIPVTGYTPGSTYTISCSCTQTGINKWGFQVSPMNSAGTLLGTPVITNVTTTKIVSSKYVTHTTAGNTGTGTKTWTFNWVAPATGVGSVTFYGAFNFANGNGNATGDIIHTSTLTVAENTTGIEEDGQVFSAAHVYPNPVQDKMVVNYGLKQTEDVEIFVSNINGVLVRKIQSGSNLPGNHEAEIQLGNEPSGIYFVTIAAGSEQVVKKVVKF